MGNLYIGASTKAYLGFRATLDWLTAIGGEIDARPQLAAARIVPFVVPSFPFLAQAVDMLGARGVLVGAQNAWPEDGAFTGEVSVSVLAEIGVSLVEIGHAERRALFAESDRLVARKAEATLRAGLTPLLCVGEVEHTSTTDAADVVVAQLRSALLMRPAVADPLAGSIVAYEPVWAIGGDRPAAPGEVDEVLALVRDRIAGETDAPIRILYGGSAGPGLISQLHQADGLFLGRFAHNPRAFGAVLDEAGERS